jgi:D-arabinose 1-dehydrogenase-like Zn-dependent alcohol dehydrogenase
LIIGHEYSGVIEEVGLQAKGFRVGDKITSEGM